jgi:hypothetical protein
MSESIFKVGQTVYCLVFGRGKVVGIDENCSHSYPVAVNFEIPGIDSHDFYTFDGKLRKAGRRTLYFSEPKIIADELPKFEQKFIGKKIVVFFNFAKCPAIGTVSDETSDFICINSTIDHCKTTVKAYERTSIKEIHIIEQTISQKDL